MLSNLFSMKKRRFNGQKKIERLTVIEKTERKDAAGSYLWRCKCSCGQEKLTTRNRLTNGVCTSCGCFQKELFSKNVKTHKLLSIKPGDVYGNLTVLSLLEKERPRDKRTWLCKCCCGKTIKRNTDFLKSKRKNHSCGCILKKNSILAKPRGWSGFVKTYSSYAKQASYRNYSFELTRQQMWDMMQMNCYYCDSAPSNIATPQKQLAQPEEYRPDIDT